MKVSLTEKELIVIINEVLDGVNDESDLIAENVTKTDEEKVKSIVKKELKTIINSANATDFEQQVERIVKKKVRGDKDIEKYIVEITRDVLVQLYKTLWVQRNFWSSSLTNAKI